MLQDTVTNREIILQWVGSFINDRRNIVKCQKCQMLTSLSNILTFCTTLKKHDSIYCILKKLFRELANILYI